MIMKTKSFLFTAIATLVGFSAFATTDKEVVGGYGNSNTRVSLTSGDYNIILKAPEQDVTNDGTMFNAANVTITSLDGATNTAKIRWNFTSTLNVDINSAVDGDVYAINLNGNSTRFNVGHIYVKNTNASATENTVAKIDVGDRLYFTTNNATQKSTFNISTNANIIGTKLEFSSAMTGGGYFIESGTTTHSVANSTFTTGTSLTVNSGATFNATSDANFTFKTDSSFNIAKGASASFYKMSAYKTSTTNVLGALTFNGGKLTFGKLLIDGGSFTAQNLAGGTDARVVVAAESSINNGGTMAIKGGLEVNKTTFTIGSTSGKLQFTDFSKEYEGRIILTDGKLVVGNSDVIERISATGAKSDSVNILFNGQSNELVVNSTIKIKQLYGYGDAPELLVTLSDDVSAKLVLMSGKSSFNAAPDTTEAFVNIANFGENRVFIASVLDELTYSSKFTLKTTAGEDIFFQKGSYNGMQGFWATTISAVVPEPAEWAVIFGAIALGLAVYRRRK